MGRDDISLSEFRVSMSWKRIGERRRGQMEGEKGRGGERKTTEDKAIPSREHLGEDVVGSLGKPL